jgi:adenine-specific DNA-methyltransferase
MEKSAIQTAFEQTQELINHFEAGIEHYLSSSYQEAEVRKEYIDKFYTFLGWDVNHDLQKNPFEQEVKIEKAQRQQGGLGQKRADYAFFLAPNYKQEQFFVEAKKPSRTLRQNKDDYFQTAKYGWNAGTGISILTDFEEIVIIDCRFRPDFETILQNQIKYYNYKDFRDYDTFEEFYWIFSYEALVAGNLATFIEQLKKPKGTSTQLKLFGGKYQSIDESFLNYIDAKRFELATAFYQNNNSLDAYSLTEATQRTIDRIVFIRFLEDKLIETENIIHNIATANHPWAKFVEYSKYLDSKYNGIVFKPLFIDDKKFGGANDDLFRALCSDLDHTNTPYDFNYIPIHILGSIYERFLGKVVVIENGKATIEVKPEVRKAGGVFYTPKYIVDYIVKNTVGKLIDNKTPKQIAELTFADIACGSGSFLIGVFEYLLDYHNKWYNENPTVAKKDGCKFNEDFGVYVLSIQQKQHILLNNIYGVDIDLQATEVTQLSLFLKMLEDETTSTANDMMVLFHEKILPNLTNNIKCGNSLIGTDILANKLDLDLDQERKLNPFDFKLAFPKVFGNTNPIRVSNPDRIRQEKGFDAIVGNPPYFSLSTLDKLQNDNLKLNYKVFEKTTDIYCLFYERAIKFLKDKGLVSYITSNQWLQTNYGKVLINYLKENSNPVTLINFGGHKIFKDATVDSNILIIENSKPKNKLEATLFKKNWNDTILIDDYHQENKLTIDIIKSEKWIIADDSVITLKKKIKTNTENLKNLKVKINYGLKTGFNEAFIINEETKDKLIAEDKSAAKIIKPIFRGRDVHRYTATWANLYLIVSQNGIDIENDYPSIYNHLNSFGNKVKIRSDQGQKWYNLRACSYYDLFETEKIIYPETTVRRSEFLYIEEECYIDKTCFMITGKDLKFINGILASRLMEWFLETELRLLGKTTIQYSKQYLENVPIPKLNKVNKEIHDTIVTLVEQMLQVKKQQQTAITERDKSYLEEKCKNIDNQINNLVYELYGLNEEEIDIVEKS